MLIILSHTLRCPTVKKITYLCLTIKKTNKKIIYLGKAFFLHVLISIPRSKFPPNSFTSARRKNRDTKSFMKFYKLGCCQGDLESNLNIVARFPKKIQVLICFLMHFECIISFKDFSRWLFLEKILFLREVQKTSPFR